MTRQQAQQFQAQAEEQYQDEVEGLATCYHALFGKWNRAKTINARAYKDHDPTQYV